MRHQVKSSEIKESWYGAKCVFLHAHGSEQLYEERIVLFTAGGMDEAIELAERDARDYAQSLDNCAYTGFVNIFQIFSAQLVSGTEVYSLMRASDLEKNQYLDRFHDTGTERTQTP